MLLSRAPWQHSHLRLLKYQVRFHASSATPANNYGSTLRLPTTTFPLWSEPARRELPYKDRTTTELYYWQREHAEGPLFVLHDGPPYANGSIHMGHALNKILKDIILRFHVLQGRQVHYVPGWDCHGLPIENKALAELKATPKSLPPQEIRAAARRTAETAVELQKSEMQHLGLMADWSTEGTYRTMDHEYELRQLRVFQSMVKSGLIYRQLRPIHWSPTSQSALAEAELIYEEKHTSKTAYVAYHIHPASLGDIKHLVNVDSANVALLIWTTTPWTLPANMAIAVSKSMEYSLITRTGDSAFPDAILIVASERLPHLTDVFGTHEVVGTLQGEHLVGLQYTNPIGDQSKLLPVIAASHVTSAAGTGLVHTAPAHGGEDFVAYKSHPTLKHFPLISLVDDDGCFTPDVAQVWGTTASKLLVGQEVLYGGNKAVLSLLKDSGNLLHTENVKHKYPYDWRTGKPIIVRAMEQWFANLQEMKTEAHRILDKVNFFPPTAEHRLESFVLGRSEWCISRQRTWGVPIPALHCKATGDSILDADSLDHIIGVLERKGVDHWWSGPVDEFISPTLAPKYPAGTLIKGTDTMDVWFDSGTSWTLLSSLKLRGKENVAADVCLEGTDQHRGWFQSLLLTMAGAKDLEDTPSAPYKDVLTHGFVLDEKGKKMSKSLGNVISPTTIVLGGKDKKLDPAYGADVLRLWAATVEYGKDVSLSKKIIEQAAESLRKLRNTARFVLGNAGIPPSGKSSLSNMKLNLVDRYILHELHHLQVEAKQAYLSYNFSRVVSLLTQFANVTLSSFYFDINKDTLYADAESSEPRQAVVLVLWEILDVLIPIMAPILPHLAEEIHANMFPESSTSVFLRGWKVTDPTWNDVDAKANMEALMSVRAVVLELLEEARRDKHLKSSLGADVLIGISEDARETPLATLVTQHENLLPQLFIVSDVVLVEEQDKIYDGGWVYDRLIEVPGSGEYIRVCVRGAALAKCPRCWRHLREDNDDLCMRCSSVVNA